ncbi:MAG: outer membrane beta-barrel domain-containing protein [Myxococcales bacterium]|nr:outer membrane beta-barrel domain-containing protein [Myxococcales bacterium]
MRSALLSLTLLAPAAALAQLQELENPGTVSAIQERYYRMNHEFTLGGGTLPLDAFYKGFYPQVSYTYHFSDFLGWQVGRGAMVYGLKTGLREQLERDFGVLPTAFEEVQWMVGSDLMLSPFYGKAAVLNRAVWHFEAFIIAGGTVFKFNRSPIDLRPAVNLGLGARLFHNRYVSYRLDITNNFIVSPKIFSGGALNVPMIQLVAALNLGATE